LNKEESNGKNGVSVCTNGAPSMLSYKNGLVAYVLKVNPNVKIEHCVIHREALVTKARDKRVIFFASRNRCIF
jgi:hypothetical protein